MSLPEKKEDRSSYKFGGGQGVAEAAEGTSSKFATTEMATVDATNAEPKVAQMTSGSSMAQASALAKRAGRSGLTAFTTPELYRELISRMGEDPDRDGLLLTPQRVEKSMSFLTRGYREDATKILRGALFSVDYDEMVIVRDIEMFSLCEHHMLPFVGKVHVAYIPNGKVIGLSKIPRLVDVFARRLQVQERLTQQIANAIQEAIAPLGVGVVIEARHLCMMMRGVEKQQSSTVTSAMVGVFREQNTRAEFLSLVRGNPQHSI